MNEYLLFSSLLHVNDTSTRTKKSLGQSRMRIINQTYSMSNRVKNCEISMPSVVLVYRGNRNKAWTGKGQKFTPGELTVRNSFEIFFLKTYAKM